MPRHDFLSLPCPACLYLKLLFPDKSGDKTTCLKWKAVQSPGCAPHMLSLI